MDGAMNLPAVERDDYSAPFFDAAKRGELAMPRCANGHFMPATQGYGGPVVRCRTCLDDRFEWATVSGGARLVSWTVLHLRDQNPPTRVAGVVELDEGPWLNALITVADHTVLRAGMPMTVGFVDTGDGAGERIPAFTPAKGS
jgi:uncharacterized OB-fold protein